MRVGNGGDGHRITDVYVFPTVKKHPEACADARLITAAPELLACTRNLIAVCDDRISMINEELDALADSGFEGDDTEAAVQDCGERLRHYETLKRLATESVAKA